MRIGILPVVTPTALKRPNLSKNGVVIENLKRGDRISLNIPLLGKGKIEVRDIELGKLGFSLNGLGPNVTVYDTENDPLLEGSKVVKRQSPNLADRLLRLEELKPNVIQDLLKPKSLGVVPRDGGARELILFLDYACPHAIGLGTVCNLGFIGNNLNFNGSEVITKENKDYAQIVLSLTLPNRQLIPIPF